jgi:hypothetical protein
MTGLCTVRKPRISSNGARLFALLELDWRQYPQPTVAVRANEVLTFRLLNLKAGGVVHIRAKATQVYCPFSCPFTTMVPLILKVLGYLDACIAYQTWSSCGRSYAGRNTWPGGTPFAARKLQLSGRFPLAVAPASFAESLCSRNFSISFCMSVIAAAKWALFFVAAIRPTAWPHH